MILQVAMKHRASVMVGSLFFAAQVMIKRDRNHPSIVIWSICNEIPGTIWLPWHGSNPLPALSLSVLSLSLTANYSHQCLMVRLSVFADAQETL